jgi:uroporphyrinogen-III decarboxylase
MKGSMTSIERIELAMNLKEADRIPVAPLNIYIFAYRAGIPLHEYRDNPKKMVEAFEKNLDIIGDMFYPNLADRNHYVFPCLGAWDQYTLNWELFDDFPPKGNIPNFYEKPIVEDLEDIMERGFSTILFNKKLNRKMFGMPIDKILYFAYDYQKLYAQEVRKFVEKYKIPLIGGSRACIPYNLALYYIGTVNFVRKVYEQPDLLKKFINWLIDYEVIVAMKYCMDIGAGKVAGADKIFFADANASPPITPPEVFEEFFVPSLKKAVDMMVNRGFGAHIHIDGDLTSVLKSLTDLTKGLPKGRIILDLEKTDMAKAKGILGDKLCLYGNVPASLLVYGTTNDVKKYCKKLIEDCGEGGGFILSTECETPWNSKPENVLAMVKSVEEFGQYRK